MRRLTETAVVRWALAALAVSVALFLLLVLISFHPEDPTQDLARAPGDIVNWGGLFGAYLAGTLIRWLGWTAYLLPLVLLVQAAELAVGKGRTPLALRLPAATVWVFASAALSSVLAPEVELYTLPLGGWIGATLGQELVTPYLGVAGVVLLAPLWLVGLIGRLGLVGIRAVQVATVTTGGALAVALREVGVQLRKLGRRSQRKRRQKKQATPEKPAKPKFVEPEAPAMPEPDVSQRSSTRGDETVPELEIDKLVDTKPAPSAVQRTLVDAGEEWSRPDLDLLQKPPAAQLDVDEKTLKAKAQMLEHKIKEYGIEGRVTAVRPGPVISIYEFKPAPGVTVNRITKLDDDLALATEAERVRIVAPIPGRDVVGIEIPNKQRAPVALRSVLESREFWSDRHKLPVAIGKDTAGAPVVADLATMPHLLVAGATGSGKSVGVNAMIVSLLYRYTPRDLRLYLIDPKRLEFAFYREIPHLEGHDVVTDAQEALALLDALVVEMERRYEWMAHAKTRQLATFNKAVREGRVWPRGEEEPQEFPYLVCIIDELADLMMVTKKSIEEPIARLAQMARAAGIHMVLATQRPSVDVITGMIKANFPTRIAFKVSSKADARVILDQGGAENLLGAGDMLFKPPSSDIPARVHGAFVSEQEVEQVVEFWKGQTATHGLPRAAVPDDAIDRALDQIRGVGPGAAGVDGGEQDELFERVVESARAEGVISTSRIQRLLGIGYNRAARIMDALQARGMVGPQRGAGKPREFIGGGGDGSA